MILFCCEFVLQFLVNLWGRGKQRTSKPLQQVELERYRYLMSLCRGEYVALVFEAPF